MNAVHFPVTPARAQEKSLLCGVVSAKQLISRADWLHLMEVSRFTYFLMHVWLDTVDVRIRVVASIHATGYHNCFFKNVQGVSQFVLAVQAVCSLSCVFKCDILATLPGRRSARQYLY